MPPLIQRKNGKEELMRKLIEQLKTLVQKPYAWAITYSIVLLCYTSYVLLDAFVIPRRYAVVENESLEEESSNSAQGGNQENIEDNGEQEQGKEENSQGETSDETTQQANNQQSTNQQATNQEDTNNSEEQTPTITDTSYSDGKISIQITTYRKWDTNIYVADIQLTEVNSLKTAFAEDTYGKNITEKTSEIAKQQDAILAINGDFYGVRSGYVIRNGNIYRERSRDEDQEDLVIYEDGSFQVILEGEITAQELLDQGAVQVLSFGPTLVDSGEVAVSTNQEVDQAKTSNPRTAIGIIQPLHYVMVVADGRTTESEGLSLYELASFLQEELGVTTAYNLDGGGSSTMYFNGTIVNQPTTNGRKIAERSVSDIVYIK